MRCNLKKKIKIEEGKTGERKIKREEKFVTWKDTYGKGTQ